MGGNRQGKRRGDNDEGRHDRAGHIFDSRVGMGRVLLLPDDNSHSLRR